MTSRPMYQRLAAALAGVVALAGVLLIASALGRSEPASDADLAPEIQASPVRASLRVPGASLDETIAGLRSRVEEVPGDYVAWATLGLAYVQQARITVDPTYYARADGALERSLEVGGDDNFLAYAGLSSLASARHDFAAAEEYARTGLAINEWSAILHGALSDALIQLGRYDEGFESVQRMADISPDTASLTRASYTWELRGDIERATELMERARDAAPNASDRAFAMFYLGELAFNSGDANEALGHYNDAVATAPDEPALLAGKAKAEAATGQVLTAVGHYGEVVERAPDPGYVVEYGRLLESLGRDVEAQRQYDVAAATFELYRSQGVSPDAAPILFEANHGDPSLAVEQAERGIVERPFIAMHDAYAWALHRAGRHREALDAIDRAFELDTPVASFHFHAGMIHLALGDEQSALDELRTAVDLNPNFDPLDAQVAFETIAELERQA